mgnify:CR=1 FL=1
MVKNNENAIKEAAYYLWENAGRPMGQDEYFWSLAVAQFSNNCKSSSCKSATSGSAKKSTASAKKTSSKSHYEQILPEVTAEASRLERRADDAEREVEKMKKPLWTERFFCGRNPLVRHLVSARRRHIPKLRNHPRCAVFPG